MVRTELPIDVLPAWLALNDVSFFDVKITQTDGKGYGVLAERSLTTAEDTYDVPSLLSVPHELVLNAEAVEEYAKEDRNFRLLLDAVGHQSSRGDILLFLLVQLVLSSRTVKSPVGVSNPWTEYVKFLPNFVPVPTLWTDEERSLLTGTSLEAHAISSLRADVQQSAVTAKLLALTHEFDAMREKSSAIECWDVLLWDSGAVHLTDWYLVDAWYRSRVLELPISGESMVPCVDMVNHSGQANSYYDENAKQEATLLLRPGHQISTGDEITISYGESKTAAEMLFSYGFIDPQSTAEGLTLPLDPMDDDPLAQAKLHIFGEQPTVKLRGTDERMQWESPFAYLMCVNEEDGLEFRVLQETDGSRQLKVFWQEEDVTDSAKAFETLIEKHPHCAIFKLRVATVLAERLADQLEQLCSSQALDSTSSAAIVAPRPGCLESALLLREIETTILENALKALDQQKSELLADETVVAYLGSMEISQNDLVGDEGAQSEDDFS